MQWRSILLAFERFKPVETESILRDRGAWHACPRDSVFITPDHRFSVIPDLTQVRISVIPDFRQVRFSVIPDFRQVGISVTVPASRKLGTRIFRDRPVPSRPVPEIR